MENISQKKYYVTLGCTFENAKSGIVESFLNYYIDAADIVEAHSKAVETCHTLSEKNSAYNYEVTNIAEAEPEVK